MRISRLNGAFCPLSRRDRETAKTKTHHLAKSAKGWATRGRMGHPGTLESQSKLGNRRTALKHALCVSNNS